MIGQGVFPPSAPRGLRRDQDVDLGLEAVADIIDEGDLRLDEVEIAAVAVEEDLDGGLLQLVDILGWRLGGGGPAQHSVGQDQGQDEHGRSSAEFSHERSPLRRAGRPWVLPLRQPRKQQVLCHKETPPSGGGGK